LNKRAKTEKKKRFFYRSGVELTIVSQGHIKTSVGPGLRLDRRRREDGGYGKGPEGFGKRHKNEEKTGTCLDVPELPRCSLRRFPFAVTLLSMSSIAKACVPVKS